MSRLWRSILAAALLLGLVAVASPAAAAEGDILARLKAIPGLTVVSEVPVAAPHRFFILSFRQYVDHNNPSLGTFQQRFTLLHRDTARPMVLHTSGYNMSTRAFRSEPTQLLAGNQISVEQRFFTPSVPENPNWSKLNIWQAATDHHRLVAALKKVYTAKWVSTGASKGGMTSVYHRRFYPNDVDGTVAYVAPNDVVADSDAAYDRFFANVGTAECRAALDAVQVEALRRRATLEPKLEAWAAANGRTFTTVSGPDRGFEYMVNSAQWGFWQYGGLPLCGQVPATTASDDDLMAWLDDWGGLDSTTDQGLAPFTPYYYQAGTQLGYPVIQLNHLKDLQRYRFEDTPRNFVPAAIPMRFQPWAMLEIDEWVQFRGSRLLFVYGQNDPWGAEPFTVGPGTKDSLSFTAQGANHGANIAKLTATETATATAALRRWAGYTPPAALAGEHIPALDDWDPAMDRSLNPVR
ncbi:S28 family serine protease [Longispora sp. K20-0274]|uniref:S28 family serine protease n=1 Tax=Longispora sp. K20-0274 TaxID=3088255 RepID=UPI00399AB585